MANKEKLSDISGAVITEGDFIITAQPEIEERYKLYVEHVDQLDDYNRQLKVRVVESTNPSHKPGMTTFTVKLNVLTPVMGYIIPRTDLSGGLTARELNNIMALELVKWLDNRPPDFKAPFAACVEYLVQLGYMERGASYTRILRPRLSRLLRGRREMFRSDGGMVYSRGTAYDTPQSVMPTSGVQPIKGVNLTKLYAGIRLLLESGVLGDVRFIDGDL